MTVKSDLLTTSGQPLRQSRCRGQWEKEEEEEGDEGTKK